MLGPFHPRLVQRNDRAAWQPLWDGYNAFYGRAGDTALAPAITDTTWQRFFDPYEPMHAKVAETTDGRLIGLVHWLLHRSTTRIEPVVYLQDLFTAPDARGLGVGRALIDSVGRWAQERGIARVYWQTHESNAAGRALYEQVARHHGFIVYALGH
ncbi:MAG: GNAT family N-acetyltransferase [Rubrivivax sp.]